MTGHFLTGPAAWHMRPWWYGNVSQGGAGRPKFRAGIALSALLPDTQSRAYRWLVRKHRRKEPAGDGIIIGRVTRYTLRWCSWDVSMRHATS